MNELFLENDYGEGKQNYIPHTRKGNQNIKPYVLGVRSYVLFSITILYIKSNTFKSI